MTAQRSDPAAPANLFSGQLQQFQDEMQRAMLQSMRAFDVLRDQKPANVGKAPKDVLWQQGTAQLYRYRRTTATVQPVPLLMVHSLVSKPYILDLIPGNSFIEYLVGQGFDVYMVDWGTPRPEDKTLTLESYTDDMIPEVVGVVLEESNASEFSLFGYCMGGLLALMYAATHPEAPLRNLVTLATPVDFSQMGLQNFWAQERALDVDRMVAVYGNIPADMIQQSFRMLKPASEFSPVRYINLWQNVMNDKFVEQYRAFDQWTNDHIPFPGACFRQTTIELARGNKLVKGTLELGGRRVDLKAITCSFLAVAAESDHIVQLPATRVQTELVGSSDKELVVMPGGHVGLAAGRKAVQTLWPKVASWLG
ncbi:MAG TPA: alpha/beta fold hydrolase, partial [Dehalococcoidia bacterium]|nr:alpha/beta fold hydrolase [Dehalococcoidia bacterium]